ncbi:putative MFS-type transporter [Saccharolobus shibatae B12]|uniref:MFS-type transporter n=1 Tax=Saccharolobus shibatae (strain ATCC 51178 / DSM 5389 / JCM 8931 / NBRC 15437 / B12) TaxID=523848 RepID=A0A8F5BQ44_SACSH|nr:MFS transporter [Saccharolobus shibatae]QXJ29404.1 putative MFS-type transporter [Saccharolobus shibatae B12]
MGHFDNIPTSIKVKSFFVSSAGFFLDGYDLSVISFAIYFISSEFKLASIQTGLITSSSLMGMILGAILFGLLSDKMGRSRIMGIDLIFFAFFGLTAALSQNFLELFISRLLLGIGIGGDYPVSSTLMAEFSPSPSRGRYLTGSVSMYWIGTLLSAVVTLFLLPLGPYFWRWVFLVGAIISVPIILVRIRLSESPRWLISKGIIKNSGLPRQEDENKGVRRYLDLFKGEVLYITLFVSSVWFLFDVASYGIGLYYPFILRQFAFPSNYEVLYGTMLIGIGAIIGYIIAEFFIDSLGRKMVLLVGLGSMSLLLILGGLVKITGTLLVPYFMSFVALEQWAGAVTLFYPTELFPTSVRSSGQGFATAVSRVGAVLGVTYFPTMTKLLGFSTSLVVFGIICTLAFIISLLMAKETKKKPLEETSVGLKTT